MDIQSFHLRAPMGSHFQLELDSCSHFDQRQFQLADLARMKEPDMLESWDIRLEMAGSQIQLGDELPSLHLVDRSCIHFEPN